MEIEPTIGLYMPFWANLGKLRAERADWKLFWQDLWAQRKFMDRYWGGTGRSSVGRHWGISTVLLAVATSINVAVSNVTNTVQRMASNHPWNLVLVVFALVKQGGLCPIHKSAESSSATRTQKRSSRGI